MTFDARLTELRDAHGRVEFGLLKLWSARSREQWIAEAKAVWKARGEKR